MDPAAAQGVIREASITGPTTLPEVGPIRVSVRLEPPEGWETRAQVVIGAGPDLPWVRIVYQIRLFRHLGTVEQQVGEWTIEKAFRDHFSRSQIGTVLPTPDYELSENRGKPTYVLSGRDVEQFMLHLSDYPLSGRQLPLGTANYYIRVRASRRIVGISTGRELPRHEFETPWAQSAPVRISVGAKLASPSGVSPRAAEPASGSPTLHSPGGAASPSPPTGMPAKPLWCWKRSDWDSVLLPLEGFRKSIHYGGPDCSPEAVHSPQGNGTSGEYHDPGRSPRFSQGPRVGLTLPKLDFWIGTDCGPRSYSWQRLWFLGDTFTRQLGIEYTRGDEKRVTNKVSVQSYEAFHTVYQNAPGGLTGEIVVAVGPFVEVGMSSHFTDASLLIDSVSALNLAALASVAARDYGQACRTGR